MVVKVDNLGERRVRVMEVLVESCRVVVVHLGALDKVISCCAAQLLDCCEIAIEQLRGAVSEAEREEDGQNLRRTTRADGDGDAVRKRAVARLLCRAHPAVLMHLGTSPLLA